MNQASGSRSRALAAWFSKSDKANLSCILRLMPNEK